MKVLTNMRLFKPVKTFGWLFFLATGLLLSGCSTTPVVMQYESSVEQSRVERLTRDITRLSPFVDPAEASEVANIAINYSYQLAEEYEITRSPIMHNLLIQMGVKERGLCIHWTEDLKKRLQAENFRSLEFHWAIGNYHKPLRLEHSSVVVTANGGSIEGGLLLDPWRYGGRLYWNQTSLDEDYDWFPREVIREEKLAQRERLMVEQSDR